MTEKTRKRFLLVIGAVAAMALPRNNPVDAYTVAAIVRDAGLTIEEFKELL